MNSEVKVVYSQTQNLYWKRQDFMELIYMQIQELNMIENESHYKDTSSFLQGFLQETLYAIWRLENYVSFNKEQRIQDPLLKSSTVYEGTPQKLNLFNSKANLSQYKNSSSYKFKDLTIYDDNRNSSTFIIGKENEFLNSQSQNQVDNSRNKFTKENDFSALNSKSMKNILQPISNNSNNQRSIKLEYKSHFNQAYRLSPMSIEKQLLPNDFMFDFDNFNSKFTASQSSDFFDQRNNYRRLNQQNLEQEFFKIQFQSSHNNNLLFKKDEQHINDFDNYKFEFSEDKNQIQNISDQRNKQLYKKPEIELEQRNLLHQLNKQDDNQSNKDFSFDDMEAYDENNDNKCQQQQIEPQKQQIQFQLTDLIKKNNIIKNSNNNEIPLKQEQSLIVQNEIKQPFKYNTNSQPVQLTNEKQNINSFQDNTDFNKYQPLQLNPKNKVSQNQDIATQENKTISQKEEYSKPQRKKKEKARSFLKAYYEQNSEDSNQYSLQNKKKKIQNQDAYKQACFSQSQDDFKQKNKINTLKAEDLQSDFQAIDQEIDEDDLLDSEEEDNLDKSDDDDDDEEDFEMQTDNESKDNNGINTTRGPYKKYSVKLKKKLVALVSHT